MLNKVLTSKFLKLYVHVCDQWLMNTCPISNKLTTGQSYAMSDYERYLDFIGKPA